MINCNKKILGIFLGLVLVASSANAVEISVVGVGLDSNASVSPSSATLSGFPVTLAGGSSFGFGGGVLAGFNVLPMIELEVGALYVTRKNSLAITSSGTTETQDITMHAFEIPLVVRYHIIPYLSVGAGGYAAIGMGNIDVASDNKLNSGVATDTSESYGANGYYNKDYGLVFSVAAHIPLTPMIKILLDARYTMDLTNVNSNKGITTPELSIKYNDYQLLAGLQFGM